MQRGVVQWAAGETLSLCLTTGRPAWIVFTSNPMNHACLALIVYAGEKHLWDGDLQYLFYLEECWYLKSSHIIFIFRS